MLLYLFVVGCKYERYWRGFFKVDGNIREREGMFSVYYVSGLIVRRCLIRFGRVAVYR